MKNTFFLRLFDLLMGLGILFVLNSNALAQSVFTGIEADGVIEELMFNSQSTRDNAFKAVEDLSGCSAYFEIFAAHEGAKTSPNRDAIEGLRTMTKDTATVATLIWSQHSTNPASEVELVTREARSEELQRLAALGGTDNIPFLQRYDTCSQAFLFSQFFLETARQEIQPG